MTKSGLKHRLSELLKESEITINRLAIEIKRSGSTIHRIIHKNSNPTHDTVERIANFFNVNPTWLLTGKGEKNKPSAEKTALNQNIENIVESSEGMAKVISFKGNKFIETKTKRYMLLSPFFEEMQQVIFAANPFDKGLIDSLPYYPVSVKSPCSGKFFSFEVSDDSMEGKNRSCLKAGSIITSKCIDRRFWSSEFYFDKHDIYVIVYEGELLIRAIENHDVENNTIVIKAYNNTVYEDRTICIDDCRLIMNVISVSYSVV